jgi:hypothetical protein
MVRNHELEVAFFDRYFDKMKHLARANRNKIGYVEVRALIDLDKSTVEFIEGKFDESLYPPPKKTSQEELEEIIASKKLLDPTIEIKEVFFTYYKIYWEYNESVEYRRGTEVGHT